MDINRLEYFTFYNVTGDTLQEILTNCHKNAPKNQEGHIGFTKWSMKWQYTYDGYHKITSFDVTAKCTVVLQH